MPNQDPLKGFASLFKDIVITDKSTVGNQLARAAADNAALWCQALNVPLDMAVTALTNAAVSLVASMAIESNTDAEAEIKAWVKWVDDVPADRAIKQAAATVATLRGVNADIANAVKNAQGKGSEDEA